MRVVVISPVVPDAHAPYAGTQFVHRRVSHLVDAGHEVVVVAPDRGENRSSENCPSPVCRFPAGEWTLSNVRPGIAAVLEWLRTGLSLGPGARLGFANSNAVHSRLASCDAVELHFAETLTLAPIIRIRFPQVVIAAVEHDVVLEAAVRQLRAGNLGQRAKALLRLPGLIVGERRLLQICDVIAVLKPGDARLLQKLGVRVPICLLAPAVSIPERAVSTPEPVVLFVAAFDRPPNAAGARWLLDKVWPRVLERVPGARLRLVGGNPPPWLVSRASPSIEVVGYVRELGPEYQRAAVAAAPLLSGAGLKMKVPQALASGLPVVATPVGAEGVADENGAPFLRVAADPEAFAVELSELLSDPPRRRRLGRAAQEFARQRFDFEGSSAAFTDEIAAGLRRRRATEGAATERSDIEPFLGDHG